MKLLLQGLFGFGIVILGVTGCEIQFPDKDLTFVHSEVRETFPVNTKLPKSLPLIRSNASWEDISVQHFQRKSHPEIVSVSDFIEPKINLEESTIDFYLRKALSDFRHEFWIPSLELEFTLLCANATDNNIYTYMITILDENLYAPQFSADTYYGVLTYTLLNGFTIQLNETATSNSNNATRTTYISVKDEDFNMQHSTVSVTCSGDACTFFEFSIENTGADKGNNFKVYIKINGSAVNPQTLRDYVKDGGILTFDLVASDNVHNAISTVKLMVSAEEGWDTSSPTGSVKSILIPVLAGSIATALVLISCTATVVYQTRKNRKAKKILQKLTEAEIREFLEGTPNLSGNQGKRSVDVNTPIMSLPYNKTFEIPREKLRIDETTILGTGAFGIVWKGSVVFSNGDGVTVAVKSVKRNVGVLYFKALLSELKIMAYIGKHPNIVSLVGACTHNIKKREVYIAVQYCEYGNFHSYLKCRRDRFSNMVVDGLIQLGNSGTYSSMYSSQGCFSKTISTMDLLKWAIQIANGLQYLESLGVIHGDLATRNVLLDSERVARIGDFGLSRRLIDYSNYYYTKTSQAPLPWKWMAPESLKDMKFSKKSDIWAFGIVLWEIFTLGQTPYPGLNWDETFVERLEQGMRPTKPAFASLKTYDLMFDCWQSAPHDRPAILDLKRALETITSSALRQKGDMGYMRLIGEQPTLSMLREGDDGYLEPNHVKRNSFAEA